MIISPCAMLMTPITPKVMASPIAASSRTLPRLIPWNKLAARPTSHSRFSIDARAASAARRNSGSVSGAVRNWSSRFFICGSVVPPRERAAASRSSLLPETSRAADRLCSMAARIFGILLGGEGLFEQRSLLGRGMPQHLLRSGEPCGRLGAEQGQGAERPFDRAAQPVVDADSCSPACGARLHSAPCDRNEIRPSGAL